MDLYCKVVKTKNVYRISNRLDVWKGVKCQLPNTQIPITKYNQTNKQIGQTK